MDDTGLSLPCFSKYFSDIIFFYIFLLILDFLLFIKHILLLVFYIVLLMLKVSFFGWHPVLGLWKYIFNILCVLEGSYLVQFTENFQAFVIYFMTGESFMLSFDIQVQLLWIVFKIQILTEGCQLDQTTKALSFIKVFRFAWGKVFYECEF